jgi:glycosyltransferase involved in cell wall biosynthesis
LKAHLKYSAKNLLSSVYVHEIILLIIKVSNYFLYRIFNRYIKQQINKYQYKTNDQNYFHNKIIYLIPSLGVGGAERQLINLINYLSKPLTLKKHEEFEILLVCFNHKTFLNDFYLSQLANNIRIIDLSEGVGFKLLIKELRKNKKYFWLGKNLIHYNRLEELVALEKPQILHAWLDTPSICGAIAGISNKVPNIILSTRSLNPSNFLSNRFYRKSVYQALSNYKQITFLNNSNAGAISYEKWLGLKKGYVKVIYNGFEIESLRTLHSNLIQKSKSSKIIIGGVMRFNYEKNLDLWIKVAKNLSEKSDLVNFVIIGDGPELSRVRRLIKKLELTKLVELVKPTNNIYSHMSKFDVLLLTSRIEGLPNVLIEAQLLGIPVVSTNCGGAIETFIDSSSGILVDNYNPKLIADTLFLLVSDREGLSRYSVNATEQAAQRFNIDTIAQQYVNIYNKI